MRIDGTNTRNSAQSGTSVNGGMQSDTYTRNIQSQIAKAQQKLKDLSSNEELSLEEKMKKRQEIQQEIANLNQQLRQYQIEQRKEQQEKKNSAGAEGAAATQKSSDQKGTGLSRAGMQAMLTADASIKQVAVQGGVAARMKGRAGVLETEIKQDAGRGNTERKEKELADVQEKARSATAAQISTLADADQAVEKAAKEEREEKKEAPADTKEASDKEEKQTAYPSVDIRL